MSKSVWTPRGIQQIALAAPGNEKIRVQRPAGPKLVAGRRPARGRKSSNEKAIEGQTKIQPILFYCSLTSTTEKLSEDVASSFSNDVRPNSGILPPEVLALPYVDLDQYFVSGPEPGSATKDVKYFYILLILSYDIDSAMTNFLSHLDETHNDFRIDTAPLSSLLGYSVFGVGDREGWPTEAEGFCSQAIEVDKWMPS
jgi:tRNA wybutosine-synthesizing protein 1